MDHSATRPSWDLGKAGLGHLATRTRKLGNYGAGQTSRATEARAWQEDIENQLRAIVVSSALISLNLATTPSSTPSGAAHVPLAAPARVGTGDWRSSPRTPTSPALSTASTADGEDDELNSSPVVPSLPAPKLSERASAILRAPKTDLHDFQDDGDDGEDQEEEDNDKFATASWGSPYARSELNQRRQSFSSQESDSEGSANFPIHSLDISTPFLRPPPLVSPTHSQVQAQLQLPTSAAAAVLVHRVRRQNRGLTEDWIRTHTAGGDQNTEARLWLSDGDSSEHSSLSGSENGWFHERDPRTPRSSGSVKEKSRSRSRRPRVSSIETLKAEDSVQASEMTGIAGAEAGMAVDTVSLEEHQSSPIENGYLVVEDAQSIASSNATLKPLPTAKNVTDKPLPREPPITPRLKKKVPWKGKNIMIMLPRDDERGLPGQPPMPLNQEEILRMFDSWNELGYSIEGFDLLVEGFLSPPTGDSQSREEWPSAEDLNHERVNRYFPVNLPDLNAWKNYVQELQEAKLRALGVSFGEEEPESAPSISSQPSRLPSAQYPPLPFSPPIPTSSASSSHALPGFPFPPQFIPAAQSPGLQSVASPGPFGIPGKFNPRQSISFPHTSSPFQQSPQGWPSQAGILQGWNPQDSPSMMGMGGVMSPQSPFGVDGFNQTGSPAFNMHQRHQSLQYLPQQFARASPRLQDVREDEEEEERLTKSPSKTPEPSQRNADQLQAEIDDAEYHLEEQLRNELEHEDYNPQTQAESITHPPFAPQHGQQGSGGFTPVEHFANEPVKPLVLHHPRPHSRGHSLSQNFFTDNQVQDAAAQAGLQQFAPLKEIPETQNADEAYEIETNPSNLGTPVQDLDFAAAFNQHQKSLSATSNPWQESPSAVSGSARHSSHGSKPSFSKLNVEAPEFKFNPTSSFTPGLFNFASNSFQPAAFTAAPPEIVDAAHFNPPEVPQFSASKINVNAPSFAPGQSEFSFSSSGPKFRPDAPAFTPFQSLNPTADPVVSSSKGMPRRADSIFGDIRIDEADLAKSAKKSKAVAILRPSSASAGNSPASSAAAVEHPDDHNKDSRAKRAKSVVPDGDDIPLFAEQPKHSIAEAEESIPETSNKGCDEGSVDGEQALPADTSMSSVVSDQLDTQATTAAPSEISPVEQSATKWSSFDFHKSKLSADTPEFIPGAVSLAVKEYPSPTPEIVESPILPAPSEPESTEVPLKHKIAPKGLAASRFASPPLKPKGLAASRFARTPSVASEEEVLVEPTEEPTAEGPHTEAENVGDREPTFEEIDAVMLQMENDHSMGINKAAESLQYPHPAGETSVDEHQPPSDQARDATPRQYQAVSDDASKPLPSTELEDPFLDPPYSAHSFEPAQENAEHELDSDIASDWEGAFSEDEHSKLQNRAQFFDARVYEVVGGLLASRLEPVEKALFSIQHNLVSKRAPSSRRDIRSGSAEHQESDADDEDEELPLQRSTSPRRDRRFDLIRLAVTEALAAQQQNQSLHNVPALEPGTKTDSALLKSLEEIKEHLVSNARPMTREEGLADASEISAAKPDDELAGKVIELQEKAMSLEQRLQFEQERVEKEIVQRRAAEDAAAELSRKLQSAETRVEVEIINRSVFDQRVADLEDRLRNQEDKTEDETKSRRTAEDRLSEVQRLLHIATEEENRLRGSLGERDERIKSLEVSSGKTAVRMATLDAARNNWTQSQAEMTNKVNVLETDLRNVRQDNNNWRAQAERAEEAARRTNGELNHVLEENKHLQKTFTTVASQLEENERLRESWRSKFLSLQEDMGAAAREVAEENASRINRDQVMIARQEVLEARLQAEAKTRERLEVEMERLQENERTGMRAVNECKRLEALLTELRDENHRLEQASSKYQREFEEARESGASEVKRTRMALQTELDSANNHVNVVREEYEEQNSKLRAELDALKLEYDTAKAQNEMLLEDAQSSKTTELEGLKSKHLNELEDLQTRHQRQVNNAVEEGQRTEQHLLERLSLSTSKTEHLQDRILHLEEKHEIMKQAAVAAAQAAKSASSEPVAAVATQPAANSDLPGKISPQALRESIMVLQEQLQAREQRIEELEQDVANLDPDAANKILKRDDEISWLRELLAVRHGDLQDIILALSQDNIDRVAVKDAAIRLKANLQMEEQERERAMNGGSAISLPNITQTLQAASPRVAQTIAPIAAAWGNWRKGNQSGFRSISGVLSSPASARNATPSKSRNNSLHSNSPLSGLITPPASGLRQTPTDNRPQPTAFANTGRRFTAQSVQRNRGESNASRRSDKSSLQGTPPQRHELAEEPMTPPMMPQGLYDEDAQAGDFDDHDFFEED